MKMFACLLFGVALAAKAQTNSIVFPQLLSATNSVLMTNAEFRCVSGNRLFFKNDAGYQFFYATNLNASVFGTLHLNVTNLEIAQEKIIANDTAYQAEKLRYQTALAAANTPQAREAAEKAYIRQWANSPQAAQQAAEQEDRMDRLRGNPLLNR
ncbi:MAG TPA: hypothetical protein VMO20_07515 [Candidatus Acidoferrum sp.]|nr:hypothetical protein [Candidatus Acidoferrum sp.]